MFANLDISTIGNINEFNPANCACRSFNNIFTYGSDQTHVDLAAVHGGLRVSKTEG